MTKIIGIDLGTTNCCVAICDDAGSRVLNNRHGSPTTPAVVALSATGRRLVGALAKRQAITNPRDTIYGIKRLIGRRWQSSEVQRTLPLLSYRCVAGPHGDVRALMGERAYAVPELASMLLYELRQVAERALGEPISRAVITVPAYFNDNQRQAIRDAARIAGLEVLRIISEPTAAALAYGMGQQLRQRLAVYDLGGGTFDISLVSVGDDLCDVLASSGDTFLGGQDFDERIMHWLVEGFRSRHGIDLRQDSMALQRLRDAAEHAKVELSSATEAQIDLPYIYVEGPQAPLHLHEILTRSHLDGLVVDLVQRTLVICAGVLEQANLSLADIDAVLLVGGMTHMPRVRAAVERFFGRPASAGAHPAAVVACGAALAGQWCTLGVPDAHLLDVTPHDLGILVAGGRFAVVVPRGSSVPIQVHRTFTSLRAGQEQVRILVAQGQSGREREILGEFLLDGLTLPPQGELQVVVTFKLSVDGLLSVTARDPVSGRAQAIRILGHSGLTEGEVDAIMDENEQLQLQTVPSDPSEEAQLQLDRCIRDARHALRRLSVTAIGGLVIQGQVSVLESRLAEAQAALASDVGIVALEACRAALDGALRQTTEPS